MKRKFMKTDSTPSMLTSLDGKRKISIEEFERLFDNGSDDIDAFVDWTQAKPGLVIQPGQKVISRVFDQGNMISKKTHIAGSTQTKKNQPAVSAFNQRLSSVSFSPTVAHA